MEHTEGVWVVVILEGTRGLLGRVKGHKKLDDNTRNQILTAKTLCLDVAFDYMSPIRPMPGPDGHAVLGREPVIMGFEFTVCPLPVYVHDRKITAFVDDMAEVDQDTYRNFIRVSIDKSKEHRASRSNITVTDRMPSGNGLPSISQMLATK